MTALGDRIIASQRNRKPIPLEVPEWGVTVHLKQLTLDDQVMLSEKKPTDMTVAVLMAALVDENDEPIFAAEDEAALRKESFAILLRVFAEAAKLNGLSTRELEEAMESFGQARAESPSTVSPSPSGDPSQNSVRSPVPN